MRNAIAEIQPHFSPTVASGSLVFVSGQFGFDAHGSISGDVRGQTLQCLRNIEELLQAHGLSRTHIVKATVWLRHAQDFAAFNSAYADFFHAQRPARSTVICALARPEGVVEIEAIASREESHYDAR